MSSLINLCFKFALNLLSIAKVTAVKMCPSPPLNVTSGPMTVHKEMLQWTTGLHLHSINVLLQEQMDLISLCSSAQFQEMNQGFK